LVVQSCGATPDDVVGLQRQRVSALQVDAGTSRRPGRAGVLDRIVLDVDWLAGETYPADRLVDAALERVLVRRVGPADLQAGRRRSAIAEVRENAVIATARPAANPGGAAKGRPGEGQRRPLADHAVGEGRADRAPADDKGIAVRDVDASRRVQDGGVGDRAPG